MDDRTTIQVPETTAQTPMGLGVLPERHLFKVSPLNRRRWQNFKANRRGYWSLWLFMIAVRAVAVRRVHRQRQAVLCALRRPLVLSGPRQLSGDRVRRRLRDRGRLPRSVPAEADRREGRLHAVAADPLLLQHAQSRPADAGAVDADLDADRGAMQVGGRAQGALRLPRSRIQLARHRRPGARRGGAPDLRLPAVGAVRAGADDHIVGDRHRGRRRAGLFRRLGRSPVPALHRNLDRGALALSAADHFVGAGAELLRAARHSAAVLLGVAGRSGARRIPARPQFRIHPGGARARRFELRRSCSATCCPTPWWRP